MDILQFVKDSNYDVSLFTQAELETLADVLREDSQMPYPVKKFNEQTGRKSLRQRIVFLDFANLSDMVTFSIWKIISIVLLLSSKEFQDNV